MEIILKFMYLGVFHNPKRGTELMWLDLSYKLKMNGLRNLMLAYLGTFLNLEDIIENIEKIRKSKLLHLYNVCLQMISIYDEVVFKKTKLFLNFSDNTMLYFIMDGRLSISELDLLLAVKEFCEVNYKKYGYDNPKHFFESKYQVHIKFPYIESDDLCKIVEPFNWVKDEYLLEAYTFNLDLTLKENEKIMTKKSKNVSNTRIQKRLPSPINKFKNSKILVSSYQIHLMKLILNELKDSRRKRFNLIYRGSRDGFKGQDFHQKCDGKGKTIIVIESQDDCIFGGYASIPWSGTSSMVMKVDLKSWLFHLKRGSQIDPYICKPKKSAKSHVYHYDYYGPCFYCSNFDLYVGQFMNTQNSYSKVCYGFTPPTGKSEFLSASFYYKVKEIEVYQVV